MVSHLKPFRVHVPILNYACYEQNVVVVVVVVVLCCLFWFWFHFGGRGVGVGASLG